MAKKITSRKNFWGETVHYDEHGRKVGVSRKNFWGGTNHYDANGNKVGESHKIFGEARPTAMPMVERLANRIAISGVVTPTATPAEEKSGKRIRTFGIRRRRRLMSDVFYHRNKPSSICKSLLSEKIIRAVCPHWQTAFKSKFLLQTNPLNRSTIIKRNPQLVRTLF